MSARGRTAVKAHPGQPALFGDFHTGNRAQTLHDTAEASRREHELRKEKRAAEALPDGNGRRVQPVLFELPVKRTPVVVPKNRVFGRVEKVEMGEVGRALGLINRALAEFAREWYNNAVSCGVFYREERVLVQRYADELVTPRGEWWHFIASDYRLLRDMEQLVDNVRGRSRDRGENAGKLMGCKSWRASISRLMAPYWLLYNVGVKPFLEEADGLRHRKAKTGKRSGKALPSEGDLRARNDERYLEAVKIAREFAGVGWRKKPEPHPKMKRVVELVREKVGAGERVLVYCAIGGGGISYKAEQERKLAIEMKEAVEAGLGKLDAKVVIAAGERKIPEGDVVISRSFFGFDAVDRARPQIGLIIYYDRNNTAEVSRDYGRRELYPAPAVTLVSEKS